MILQLVPLQPPTPTHPTVSSPYIPPTTPFRTTAAPPTFTRLTLFLHLPIPSSKAHFYIPFPQPSTHPSKIPTTAASHALFAQPPPTHPSHILPTVFYTTIPSFPHQPPPTHSLPCSYFLLLHLSQAVPTLINFHPLTWRLPLSSLVPFPPSPLIVRSLPSLRSVERDSNGTQASPGSRLGRSPHHRSPGIVQGLVVGRPIEEIPRSAST